MQAKIRMIMIISTILKTGIKCKAVFNNFLNAEGAERRKTRKFF